MSPSNKSVHFEFFVAEAELLLVKIILQVSFVCLEGYRPRLHQVYLLGRCHEFDLLRDDAGYSILKR